MLCMLKGFYQMTSAFVNYSQGFSTPSAIRLAGWLLLASQFIYSKTTCPPPDFPERGRYEPAKGEFEAGQTIAYHCDSRLPMIDANHVWLHQLQVATCLSSGKWSRGTPFCDTPAKLINPITSSEALGSAVLDTDPGTCSLTRNDTEESLRFSLDREAVVYATIMCWSEGNKTVKIFGAVWKGTHRADTRVCGIDTYQKTNVKTKYITVQVSSESTSSIKLCVIEVFTKDDKWCGDPPSNNAPHGHLEVGRSKAVLHCIDGFKEKDGRGIYAICNNNKWSYQEGLECVDIRCGDLPLTPVPSGQLDVVQNKAVLRCNEGFEEKNGREVYATCENSRWSYKSLECIGGKLEVDYKTLAILFGFVIVIIILIWVGLKLFFTLRKKTREVTVVYKPGDDKSFFSPLYDRGQVA